MLELLNDGGLTVYTIHEGTEVVIIGRDDEDKEGLSKLLDEREGQHLKVYSQEMFFAYWLSGCDPLANREVALAFGEGHPALESLLQCGFDWPSTFVSMGNGVLNIESPELGVLRCMGYKVGKSGRPANHRRGVLRQIFQERLIQINSPLYMQEWGLPQSKERLKKMANCLATFCKRQKVKGNLEAASHYESDLIWLRESYYSGRFKFEWPSTLVRR